jgi:PAS domain S-box-containing protein
MGDRVIRSDRPRRRRWSAGDVQEALVISGEIPLWLVDGDDRIAFVNDAAVRTLGYDSDDELLGRPSHDTVHWKHPDGSPYPSEDCPITHATRRGEPIRMERDWWVRKDGSMVPISIHCVQIEIDGRMGTAMTFHDLTASVQAEDERRRLEVERARLAEVRASRTRIVEAADEQRVSCGSWWRCSSPKDMGRSPARRAPWSTRPSVTRARRSTSCASWRTASIRRC